MATLSLRMRDDLKRKAQQLAKAQGVSLNGFINKRVLKFMYKTRPGQEPSIEEIERAMRG